MRRSSLWRRLRVQQVVVEDVHFEGRGAVDSVRLYSPQPYPCGKCGRRFFRYHAGEDRRRWRAVDLGSTRAFIEAEAPRVSCPPY